MGTQGIIKFDFTQPQIHVGTYYHLGIVLNYDIIFSSSLALKPQLPMPMAIYTTTIPYTGFNSSAISVYFQMGVIFNSDYSPLDPYYVDNFRLIGHGDFNEDGHVDSRDIAAMESALTNPTAYETTYGLSAANLATIGDFDGDLAISRTATCRDFSIT